MTGRLYFIGQGGSSWRDPRNWARERGGKPLRHLHARGDDVVVVGFAPAERGSLDLRGMPYASVEVNGYQGALILPDGSRAIFPGKSRRARARAWLLRRNRLRPVIPRSLVDAMGRAGGWQQAVRDGLATLILTRRGWVVVPLLGGGSFAAVRTGAVASNGGGTGAVSPTYSGGLTTSANLLVGLAVATVGTSGGTWTVANSQAGWTLAVSDTSRTNVQSAIFYRANCGTNESPPTFQYSNSATVQAVLIEFSGALKASPLDQTGHSNAVGGTTTTANGDATCGGTDVAAGELIVTADAFSFGSNTTMASSDSYNNGATPTGNLNNDATSTRNHYRFAYGITTGNSNPDDNTYENGKVGGGSIASACIASFKVAINVTKTGAFPYEATQALAVTAVDPYEALKGLAATNTGPYEAEKSVAATQSGPYEALGGIVRSVADTYESLAGIRATAAEPYESNAGIARSLSEPYEANTGVAASASEPYEAEKSVAATQSGPYEALKGLAQPSALAYESVEGLAVSVALPYSALRAIAALGTLEYEAVAAVVANGSLPIESVASIGAIQTVPYEALEEFSAVSGLPYSSLRDLATDAAFDYETLAELAATGVFPVESLEALTEDVSLPYETILIILFPAGKAGTLTHARTGGISETLAGQISHSTTGLLAFASKGRITKARHR